MDKDNPACYECPKDNQGIHTWQRKDKGSPATCKNCKLVLSLEHTRQVFDDNTITIISIDYGIDHG